MTQPTYIVIGGGSFQGKSIAALHIANKLRIPSIICTDMIRNVLKSVQPDAPWLGTSTYLLTPGDLLQQMIAVSEALTDIVEILVSRGESAIIEGMHITSDCLQSMMKIENARALCVNCQLSFADRIETKAVTRNRLFVDRYRDRQDRIVAIHQQIVAQYSAIGAPIVGFNNLEDLRQALDHLINAQSPIDDIP